MILKSQHWFNLRICIPKLDHYDKNISQCAKYRVINELRMLLQEMIPEVLGIKKVHISKCPILNNYGFMNL
jgi:hypothetical protein